MMISPICSPLRSPGFTFVPFSPSISSRPTTSTPLTSILTPTDCPPGTSTFSATTGAAAVLSSPGKICPIRMIERRSPPSTSAPFLANCFIKSPLTVKVLQEFPEIFLRLHRDPVDKKLLIAFRKQIERYRRDQIQLLPAVFIAYKNFDHSVNFFY